MWIQVIIGFLERWVIHPQNCFENLLSLFRVERYFIKEKQNFIKENEILHEI